MESLTTRIFKLIFRRHTGKVGPGTRDFVSEVGPGTLSLGPGTQDPGPGTHYAGPGTLDEKYILQTKFVF